MQSTRSLVRLSSALAAIVLAVPHLAVAQTPIPEVVFTAQESGYEGPDQIPSGFVQLTLQNEGQEPHEVGLAQLKEGTDEAAFAEELLALLNSTSPGEENFSEAFQTLLGLFAAFEGGPPTAGPGQSKSVVVELEPGRYVLMSLGEGEGPRTLKFLEAVAQSGPAPEAPHADQTIRMVDFAFAMPPDISAGAQTWEVVNMGQQIHHMILFKLAPGKTFADLQAFMETEEGAPPFDETVQLDSLAVMMSPGERSFYTLDLPAGEYVATCFVPDHESGAPHIALGMLVPFTVAGE
jgi:hypothetical protein